MLYDPCDLGYVLIANNGKIIERAEPHKPGVAPSLPEPENRPLQTTDYLAQLRTDHESRTRRELDSLRLQAPPSNELDLPTLVSLLESCRDASLAHLERSQTSAFWRKFRPMEAADAKTAIEGIRRRNGSGLHLSVYLQALEQHFVRTRSSCAKGGKS